MNVFRDVVPCDMGCGRRTEVRLDDALGPGESGRPMTLKVLRGRKSRREPCEACNRIVASGRRHKATRRAEGFCPGAVSEREKRRVSLYVATVEAFNRAAMYGPAELLEKACHGALKAFGIDPDRVPLLERWRREEVAR